MNMLWLGLVFLAAAAVGYRVIRGVPSLLHTPLMSGMNALSGITVLGALSAAGGAVYLSSQMLAFLAVTLAAANVVGGFLVTHRMLRLFRTKERGDRA